MNQAAKQYLRQIVLRTRNYWPFGYLYRSLYWFGLKIFVIAFSRFREIRSIYLRGSLSTGDWVPGDSDIDLSIVIDDLDPEVELGFLKKFWKRLRLMEDLLPFISNKDITLLTLKELSQTDLAQKRFPPFSDSSIQRWRLLLGEECRRQEYSKGDRLNAISHMRHLYRSIFAKFYAEPSLEGAPLRQYHRIVLKVMRLICLMENRSGLESEAALLGFPEKYGIEARALAEELARVRQENYCLEAPFEHIARCLYGVMHISNDLYHNILEDEINPRSSRRSIMCSEGPKEDFDEETFLQLRQFLEGKIETADPWVRCVLAVPDSYTSQHALYIILSPHCPLDSFQALIHRVRDGAHFLNRFGFEVKIMLEDVFKGEIYFPYGYNYNYALLRHGQILYGQDIRTDLRKLPDDHVIERLRHLSFVWAPLGLRRLLRFFSGAEFEFADREAVYGLMNYRLVTEKNIFASTPRQTAIEYQRHYAQEAETRWLTDFHEMVLNKKTDARTVENLYFFARRLLKTTGVHE